LTEADTIAKYAEDTVGQVTLVYYPLAKLHIKKGNLEKAEEIADKIKVFASKFPSTLVVFQAELLKAMVFRERKDWGQSLKHFEKSLQVCSSLNLQKWNVFEYTDFLYEYGLIFLMRNEQGDREKAYTLLDEALEISGKMDAKKQIEKIIATKKLLTS
jgi:tetratricopeptide (TPR) repeat protein